MRVFITGTDTNIGKTVISSWLALHAGFAYVKPIQTGTREGTDSIEVKTLSQAMIHPESFHYQAPLSPHLAASLENGVIDIDQIRLPCEDRLIIEGAGGLLVPLNATHLIIDLIKKLETPVILVCHSRLGTINHTLLSLEALRSRDIPILGVIMNGPPNHDNKKAIELYGQVEVIAEFPPLPMVNYEALKSIPLPARLAQRLIGPSQEASVSIKLSKRDKRLIWHPFTQEKTADDVISIHRAAGSYIYDENGKAYLDLISSWWVNLHGHAHPDIAKRIYDQAQTLEHVMFAGFTHEPAVHLCEALQTILPAQLSKFFFSDNGSTAVEVALKMAYQYWRNVGDSQRTLFLSFEGGYHGDTFGAMSVGAQSGFHDAFGDLCFNVLSVPYPDSWEGDQDRDIKEQHALKVLQRHLDQHGPHIAAMILEPLIQGASGMRICKASFVEKVIKLVRQHHILVIFDEIMTGFGRTGTYFALHQLGCIPDFLCISKGITGGFLPLALTITQDGIYDAFLGDAFTTAFAHGHSYTANPLACSAAITSLQLLKNASCQQAISAIHHAHRAGIDFLKANVDCIEKTRMIGTISAFDMPPSTPVNASLKAACLQEGLLLRPLGNTVYLLPPYSTTAEELKQVYQKIADILHRWAT